MIYRYSIDSHTYQFEDLKAVLAKATPARSGDYLAGVAAETYAERMAARMCLAEISLKTFLEDLIIPYESDEVTRLIVDTHNQQAFAEISHLTVGDFRDWLLTDEVDTATLTRVAPGITPEMAAAVSKLMRNQDLILVAKKCQVITAFRNTIGLPGHISTRLQPNHPTDDPRGIAASIVDGLLITNSSTGSSTCSSFGWSNMLSKGNPNPPHLVCLTGNSSSGVGSSNNVSLAITLPEGISSLTVLRICSI